MRIALIIEASGGGAGKHVLDCAELLLAAGHEVHLYYSPLRADQAFMARLAQPGLVAFPIALQRAPHPADLGVLWQLYRTLKDNGPYTILHAHSAKAGLLTATLSFFINARTIFTPHLFPSMNPVFSTAKRAVYRLFERILFRRFATIICVAEAEYNYALARLHIAPTKLAHIPNGIAPLKLASRQAARAAMQLNDEVINVGAIGRLMPEKGMDILLRSAQELKEQELPPYKITIIGEGPDSALLEPLLSTHAQMLGYMPAAAVLAGLDVLVLPSRVEAFPYIILEAMQAGLPIIATNVGSVSTMTAGAALIVPSGDQQALATAIARVITDHDLRTQLAANAHARAALYTLEAMGQKLQKLYAQM